MKDILAVIEEQERLATAGGELQQERLDALDAYLGRPYGDEEEGRSQVVMRDVADTIEWIKPSLMKVFCSGDEVVQFMPVGPEDEEQAQQETDYCNDVLMRRNDGFLVLHDWFHDALLQKNGYVLVSTQAENRTQKDQYEGLTDDEFALLTQDENTEVVEHTQRNEVSIDQMGQPTSYITHDAVVQCRREYRCLKITNIPPERVLVAPDWPGVSIQGCPFVEVIDFKTISELREDGFDVEDTLSDSGSSDVEESDAFQRRNVTQDEIDNREDLGADAATRRVRVRYVWMRYDKDGDGLAEQRRYVVVGKTILEDEEDELIPVACCTPYRVPHEHNGMSVHDIVQDIQRIRTALVRGFLDNMYLANNGRYAIDANSVNLDDMLVTRPGGIVRVAGTTLNAISPLTHPQDGGSIMTAVEYIDSVRENRTGVTKYNQGLDANSLNKTMGGITQIMSASQQRIELIARVIAETGMKQLMWLIHAMSLKHSREQELVKLRNRWVPVDPRSWKTRRDLSVSVGLGTGNKDQMLVHLQMILGAQQQALPLGIAQPKNIYNALVKLTQNAGFKEPDQFWTDPGDAPMQPPQDPNAMKAQADIQVKQAEMQIKGQQMQADLAMKQQESQIDLEKARVELQIKLAELDIKRQELELKARSAELDHQISLQRGMMQASDDMARARQIESEQ